LISVDTRKAAVARAAVSAGAHIINDVSAGRFDEDMLATAAECGVPLILMHSRGSPQTMDTPPHNTYSDVSDIHMCVYGNKHGIHIIHILVPR
jgi:dihydropteroate synthase